VVVNQLVIIQVKKNKWINGENQPELLFLRTATVKSSWMLLNLHWTCSSSPV